VYIAIQNAGNQNNSKEINFTKRIINGTAKYEIAVATLKLKKILNNLLNN